MRILTPLLALSTIALVSVPALADDTHVTVNTDSANQPGVYGGDTSSSDNGVYTGNQAGTVDTAGTTTTQASEVSPGGLRSEAFSFRPMLGVLAFRDPVQGSDTARAAAGLGLDWNISRVITSDPSIYFGPSTGLIYSHLGSSGSNLFGSNTSLADNSPGSNFFMIPVNAKLGYNMGDNFRLSVHGGGNVVYRTVAQAINLGTDSVGVSDSAWKMLPNVGFDVEAALAKNVVLGLRPDVTFSNGGDNFFNGMVQLGIGLG